jgi:hypothetical protein
LREGLLAGAAWVGLVGWSGWWLVVGGEAVPAGTRLITLPIFLKSSQQKQKTVLANINI